jgi:hypothetical protein
MAAISDDEFLVVAVAVAVAVVVFGLFAGVVP